MMWIHMQAMTHWSQYQPAAQTSWQKLGATTRQTAVCTFCAAVPAPFKNGGDPSEAHFLIGMANGLLGRTTIQSRHGQASFHGIQMMLT
jgi:hypothetical protein